MARYTVGGDLQATRLLIAISVVTLLLANATSARVASAGGPLLCSLSQPGFSL